MARVPAILLLVAFLAIVVCVHGKHLTAHIIGHTHDVRLVKREASCLFLLMILCFYRMLDG